MGLIRNIARGTRSYIQQIQNFNRNIRLLLLGSVLGGVAQGIISVDFNLYIVSLGIHPDDLGKILSAGPFAHALASIPIGFLGELLGYRTAFVAIYGIAGLSQLAQVATPNINLISIAAFVGGLALSGNFVVRLPFLAANVKDSERTHIFSVNSLIHSLTLAIGSLLAGHLPNLMKVFTSSETLQYRYTLYLAGFFTLISVVPMFLIKTHKKPGPRKISLYPYLWGMDTFTIKSAIIELFIGLTMGLILPFMNLYFINHLGTSREYFSTVAALAVIPTMLAAAVGPLIASRLGDFRAIVASRYIIPVATVAMALTASPAIASGGYWLYRALFTMGQALWFAYAMAAAAKRAKVATSAWLEITFWLGQALAALITGSLLADANYVLPFYLSSGAAIATGVLTQVFVGQHDRAAKRVAAATERTERSARG
jgi:MFS family permease